MDASLGPILLHWHWRPDVLLVLLAGGAVYVGGWRRLRARGHRHLAPRWRLAAYLGGLVGLALALLSPLDHIAETLFTAHMLQHQLLLMVAPPLLLLGNPFPLVMWGLPRRLRAPIGRVLARHGRVRAAWRLATWMPVAGLLYALNLGAWHLPAAYEAALRHGVVHDLEHVAFFGTAILFWWPVVNPAPRLHRLRGGLHYGYRIGYLILATGLNTFVGAVLGLSERVLYPSYAAASSPFGQRFGLSPLDDQALGGGLMWSGGHMFLIGILILLHRTMEAEGRVSPAPAPLPGEPPPGRRGTATAQKEGARPAAIV